MTHKRPEPLAASVEEASTLLGVGRSTVVRMLREGKLPRVKLGARTLIPMDAIRSLVRVPA
jgi:excisionase family DNA binding protein